MTPSPVVSIIIPTYNRAHLLRRAIDSVQAQTFDDIEIIVVDDASIDDTKAVVDSYDNTRILYIQHQNNKGGGAARNTGISAASGAYVAFLDSDDEWIPQKLEKQLHVFEKGDSELGLVYTAYAKFDWKGEFIHIQSNGAQSFLLNELLRRNFIGTTSTVLVKRDCLIQIGGFDERFESCQDWDLWIRLAKKYTFEFISESLVNYFRHTGERISTNPSLISGYELILEKYRTDIEACGGDLLAEHYFRIGYRYMASFGEVERSKQYLLRAIKSYPFSIKYYAYLMANILGEGRYRLLQRLRQALRRRVIKPFNRWLEKIHGAT